LQDALNEWEDAINSVCLQQKVVVTGSTAFVAFKSDEGR